MINGLGNYGPGYWAIEFDPRFLKITKELEEVGKSLMAMSHLSKSDFTEFVSERAEKFLGDVEKWRETYLDGKNCIKSIVSTQRIASAFYDFKHSRNDMAAISSLKRIFIPEGRTQLHTAINRTKRAIIVARFLDPDNWGLVSWRVLALLGFNSIDGMKRARCGTSAEDMCEIFEFLSDDEASEAMKKIRTNVCDDLQNAADVSTALYALSLNFWIPGTSMTSLK